VGESLSTSRGLVRVGDGATVTTVAPSPTRQEALLIRDRRWVLPAIGRAFLQTLKDGNVVEIAIS